VTPAPRPIEDRESRRNLHNLADAKKSRHRGRVSGGR
jgi:hypothetical protein